MKKIIIAALLLFQVSSLFAQNITSRDEFIKLQREKREAFKQKSRQEYEAFIQKRNEEYAQFLSDRWELYQISMGLKVPEKVYPKTPTIRPEDEPKVDPISIPFKEVKEIPAVEPIAPEFQPDTPLDPQSYTPSSDFKFSFAGSTLTVGLNSSNRFTLSGVGESDISQAWALLSNGGVSKVIEDCLYWKQRLSLNDYLYMQMIKSMCEAFFSGAQSNEARLLRVYIMTQCGYDAKCARCEDSDLVVLLSIEETIYQTSYLMVDGYRYYLVDGAPSSNGSIYTFAHRFSEESKSCSVRIDQELTVDKAYSTTRKLTAKGYPNMEVSSSVDMNLIELYNSYPQCDWDVYAQAPMSQELAALVLPQLRAQIEGKNELLAANMILDFVQTAFAYKSDGDYFGYERSLFVDENFYYPYCDCEDRSYLYSNLIKNLLGLDMVLLHYPNHMATAVRFNTDFNGDYLVVKNQKYIICDPTYIGADIGEAMPQFKDVEAEVVIF